MLGYLKKFNDLPAEIKDKVSNQKSLAAIEELEQKFKLALAALVMKVAVKEVALNDLPAYLLKENLASEQADQLTKELKEKIFSSLENHLSAGEPVKFEAPKEPGVKGASFFFSPDDEDEIRELAKKIDLAQQAALPEAALDAKLEEIINQSQINFGSADLAGRFKQILKTYLRGIRNKLEAKITLTKPFLSGGLSFDEDSAEKVMVLADKIMNSRASAALKPRPKITWPEIDHEQNPPARPPGAVDAAYDFSKFKKPNQNISNDLKKLDTKHELSAPTEKAALAPANVPALDLSQLPLIRRRFEAENLSPSPKVKIEDVKFVPRVMSPLDELKYSDLLSFRRLDKDLGRAAEKIKDKINLLEEQGYDKRLEAIKLWRLSPLNKLYLAIGQSSIGENKPIDVIIEERKTRGEDSLTVEEFQAVMDLNKSLRF